MYSFLKNNFGKGGTVCNGNTHICVEGYPSSANSYTYHILKYLTKDLNFGHHCHSFANVKLAIEYQIPAIVLIRKPENAIASRIARFDSTVEESLLEYTEFYELTQKYIQSIILITFDEIIHDTASVLNKINNSTQIEFSDYNNLDDVNKKVRDRMHNVERRLKKDVSNISLPSEERNKLKEDLKNSILGSPLFNKADAVYKRLQPYSILVNK